MQKYILVYLHINNMAEQTSDYTPQVEADIDNTDLTMVTDIKITQVNPSNVKVTMKVEEVLQ